jgi:hypothetical protein
MEKYREILKRRITFGGLYCCLAILPNVLLNFFFCRNPFTNFIMGAMVGSIAIAIVLMTVYGTALKDEAYLKKMYIKENDERRKLIRTKSRNTAITIILLGLLIAMMISGYFSKVVFFTLLGVEVFIAAVALLLKLYYNKKI